MKQLDKKWLINAVGDEASKKWINKIVECHEYVKNNNVFVDSDEEFYLNILGCKIFLTLSSSFSAIEVFCEIFKENAHLKFRQFMPGKPSVILDIGANQGFFSLKLKKLYPDAHIIAVEPNPIEFDKLQKNMIANKCCDTINIENLAVADTTGVINMEIVPQIGAIGGKKVSIPERSWMKDEFVKTIQVHSTSLDDLLKKYSFSKRIDLVKIDVEGFEFDILKNSKSLNKIDRVVIEYHSKKLKKDLIEVLESNDFCLLYDDTKPTAYYGDIYFKHKRLMF
jgi:FkbM family methyltransferase